jgi:integrase
LSTGEYDLGSQNQQQQGEEAPRIYFVIAGLKSKHTKRAYHMAFNHFLDKTVKSKDLSALLNTKQSVIESKIIDYVTYLKDVERLTYRTISVHLSAIFHFFEINDYDDLRRKKIKRFMPEDESEYYSPHHQQDRAYSIPELEQILKKCDIRARVAVLLMLSSGMRIGGLHELQLGDIKKIDEFELYMIWVYNRSRKHRYYTFCSRECTAAIDEYLSYRQKFGDPLKSTSPLIRDKFSVDNPFTAQAPRLLSLRSMSLMFEQVLKHAKINPIIPGRKQKNNRRAVATSHGFRKFFVTQCDKSGMSFTTREYLSGHRLPNLDASYIRVTEEDRLAEYVKAIDLLTVDPTKRLEQKVQDLEGKQAEEIERLKSQLQGYKDEQARAQDTSSESIRKLRKRLDATEDKHEKALLALEHTRKFLIHQNEKHKKSKSI